MTDLCGFDHQKPITLLVLTSRNPSGFIANFCVCVPAQGLGALIVRVDAADILHKLFWGGGAVSLATSSADFHVLKCRPADKLEDGTVNFLDIISLKVCQ